MTEDQAVPLHQHHTSQGPVDCHVSDCDVYQIQARARRDQAVPLPDDAVTLAADAIHFSYIDASTDEPSCRCLPEHPTARYDRDRERAIRALAAAAPALYRQERERITAVISPGEFRALADWFDADDALKATAFPTLDYPPGDAVQAALREFADLLEGDADGK